MANTLYYGDNLLVLRDHVPDESVDLVYLDPPFNSNASYNVLFKERTGEESPAQIRAFTDTWEWTQETQWTYETDILQNSRVPSAVKEMISAFRNFVGQNALMAYLAMMTPRLVELRRVLKPKGSLYLHCDTTAGHYLKILLDTIFGKENFRNEIVWKRTSAHGDTKQGSRHFGRVHDNILRYSKSKDYTWVQEYIAYGETYISSAYRHVEVETGRKYRLDNLTTSRPGGDTSYEWHGVSPYQGRYWAYSRHNMERFEKDGRLIYSKSGFPQYKRYLDEMPGMPV